MVLELEFTPNEEAVKIVKMTAQDLECSVHLADKVAAGFEGIDSNFENSSMVSKILLNSTTCYRTFDNEMYRQWLNKFYCCLIIRSCHSHPNLRQHHPCQSASSL